MRSSADGTPARRQARLHGERDDTGDDEPGHVDRQLQRGAADLAPRAVRGGAPTLPTAGIVVTETSTPMSAPLRASVSDEHPDDAGEDGDDRRPAPSGREMNAVSSRSPRS